MLAFKSPCPTGVPRSASAQLTAIHLATAQHTASSACLQALSFKLSKELSLAVCLLHTKDGNETVTTTVAARGMDRSNRAANAANKYSAI